MSIMGPSGSGKTTLLNVIGMLDGFDEGEYKFLHEEVHKMKERQRTQLYKQYIGFVFKLTILSTNSQFTRTLRPRFCIRM